MKCAKMTGFLASALLAFGSNAMAIDVGFDPDGAGPLKFLGIGIPANQPIPLLAGLDWAPGNALADNSVPLVVGSEFFTYYQAKLSVFNLSGGGTATTFNDGSGLLGGVGTLSAPATFEWTVNARFKERVTGFDAGSQTAFFEVVDDPANYLKIFYDPTPNSNDATGTGFIDGTEILSATIVVDSNSQFQLAGAGPLDPNTNLTPSVYGSGSFNITARVDTFDNNFIKLGDIPLNGPEFVVTLITSTLELPFGPSDPTVNFEVVGGASVTPSIGAVNGQSGPDFLFEADGNQTFDVRADVPEPATAALGLMGLAGLALRRRKQA